MRYTPRPHDIIAIDHLLKLPFAGLFYDMGMGKSGSTLAALRAEFDYLGPVPTLVVGPKEVINSTWPAELRKWDHTFSWRQITSQDLKLARRRPDDPKGGGLYIPGEHLRSLRRFLQPQGHDLTGVSFDMLPHLVKLFGKDRWPWPKVIIDESSCLKDPSSARFRALKHIRPVLQSVWELGGTPAPNGLEQLFPQIYLLDEGERLGASKQDYLDEFFRPDKRNGQQIYSWKTKPGKDAEIHRRIGDLCLSLKSEDWLKLPPRIYTERMVKLSDGAMDLYRTMQRNLIIDMKLQAANPAVLVGKLLQMASGNVYESDKTVRHLHDCKLDALEEIVEATPGGVLLGYWFDHSLERIKRRFGKTFVGFDEPGAEARWNRGEIKLMGLHPRSGSYGLNLQEGGSTTVWYDLTHDLELYLQFNKRLHRSGQAADRVVIQHLIAEGTIDEDVYRDVLPGKNNVQEALLAALRRRQSGTNV